MTNPRRICQFVLVVHLVVSWNSPVRIAQKRNLFRQTSNIHCVKYLFEFGCILKKLLRRSRHSQARNSENQVKQAKQVARARNSSLQPPWIELLHPRAYPMPSATPYRTITKPPRQSAAIHSPYTTMSTMSSMEKMPRLRSCGGRLRTSGAAISNPRPMSGTPE